MAKAAAPCPRLISDFPRFVAEAKRLEELHSALTRAEQERDDVEQQQRQRVAPSAAVDSRAEAILAGAAWEETQELPRDALQQRHRELEEGIRAIKRAIDLQQLRVQQVRGEASAAVCGELRPKHFALVRRVANALLELSRAVEAERRFRFDLEQDGFNVLLPSSPGNLNDIGLVSDVGGSRIWHYFYEAVERGFVRQEEFDLLRSKPDARLEDDSRVLEGQIPNYVVAKRAS